jgi:hypothetical protein
MTQPVEARDPWHGSNKWCRGFESEWRSGESSGSGLQFEGALAARGIVEVDELMRLRPNGTAVWVSSEEAEALSVRDQRTGGANGWGTHAHN